MFRANPNIQIAALMQQFQCDLPKMTCKTQSESQDSHWRTNTIRAALAQCQVDTVISGLVRMSLHDLLTQVPTGHNDPWASENVTS